MTSPIDNQTTDNADSKNNFYDYLDDFDNYDDFDFFSEQSVYSEPMKPTRDYRSISRVSAPSKEGQILIRRDVPLKLRDTIKRKFIKIPVYESSLTPNHRIKNAITGISTPHRVGSQAESFFFKVCFATGVEGRREPINLFFETPNDYEKHFLESVSDDVKEKWAERYRVVERAYIAAKQERNNLHMQKFTFVH